MIKGVSLQIGQQSLALKTPGFTMPQTETYGFGGVEGKMREPKVWKNKNLSQGERRGKKFTINSEALVVYLLRSRK